MQEKRVEIVYVCCVYEKQKRKLIAQLPFVRKMGLEPTREYTHKILSLARLPIPTLPLTVSVILSYVSSTRHNITQLEQFVNTFLQFFEKIFLLEKFKKQVDKSKGI